MPKRVCSRTKAWSATGSSFVASGRDAGAESAFPARFRGAAGCRRALPAGLVGEPSKAIWAGKPTDVGGTSDPAGSPVYLNDFKNTTYQGEIAVLNVYGRALSSRQAAVLYQQVVQNTNWPASVATTTGLRLNYEARIGALVGRGGLGEPEPARADDQFERARGFE